ncbi:MAG: class I SAM-dependent methyltransferase [Bacteroidota bacterium]
MFRKLGNQLRKPRGLFGRLVSAGMKRGNSNTYEIMIDKLKIKDKEALFEIGYGPGIGIERILSKYNCTITGIDFSKLMHKEATKRNKKFIELNKAKLSFGDFLSFELDEQSFDKIYCINVIYFWNDLEKPFSSILKGLKNNGSFYFYMDNPEDLRNMKFAKDDIFNKYSIEHVVKILNLVGFSKITFENNKGYFVECKK